MSQQRTADRIECVEDARLLAQHRLPKFLYQRYESGTGLGLTLRDNAKAYEAIRFRPHAAVAAPTRQLATTLLGHPLSMPVVLAPIGSLRTGAPGDGELAVARAAGAAGTIQSVSTFTGYPIEEITAAASGPIFYQLFYLGSRERAEQMIDRAQRAGCAALVLTVDVASPNGFRERPRRDRVHSPRGFGPADMLRTSPQVVRHLPWFTAFFRDGRPRRLPMAVLPDGSPMPVLDAIAAQLERIPVWDDLEWIRACWDGPIVVKGILSPDDARRARDLGAEAIVVSNHGGNHLDGSVPTIEALPAIAAAVRGEVEIVIDGGVRRGADVVKALALGADVVQLGRAYLFALLAAGEPGVRRILELFRQEIDDTLAAIGCTDVHDLDPSFVSVATCRCPAG